MQANCECCYGPKENREWKYCRRCNRKLKQLQFQKELSVQMAKVNQTATGVESLDAKIKINFPR